MIISSKENRTIRVILPNNVMDLLQYNMSPKNKHSQNVLKNWAINFSGSFHEL